MIRAMMFALTLVAASMFATGAIMADDRHHHGGNSHYGGYSHHGGHSGYNNGGFVQFNYGNPYGGYGYYARPVYNYGYAPYYGGYGGYGGGYGGGCGGHGYGGYNSGVSFGFRF